MQADSPPAGVLTHYWSLRPNLTQAEWEDFYRLVRGVLMHCSAPQLASLPALPNGREAYIHDFFLEKVFYKDGTPDGTLTPGGLAVFFRNFLTDQIRGRANMVGFSEMADGDDGASFEAQIHDPAPVEKDVADFLVHNPIEKLGHAANTFLQNLEGWGRLMLGKHYCADDDAQVPMSTLCQGIKSYQYKASKLGVASNRRDQGLLGFEHTLIGQWILSLGVELSASNLEVIHLLLQILCQQALEALEAEEQHAHA